MEKKTQKKALEVMEKKTKKRSRGDGKQQQKSTQKKL